jgi:hypothetical protein
LTLDEKGWRGDGDSSATAGGKFKQSFEVGLALLRESYNFEIDDLLAREADARDEPGDCGMKPEGGAKNFFRQVMGPIVTANVKQFMAGNRGLESRVHGWETFGQKDEGSREAKGDGGIYIGRKAEFGAGVHASAHLFENGSGFS